MNEMDLIVKEKTPATDAQSIALQKKKEDLQKIKKACKDFESVFTYYLFKTMRQTIPKSSIGINNFVGKDTYTMMMDQKIAEELSNKGNGLGLQKMLFEQLTKNYSGDGLPNKIK